MNAASHSCCFLIPSYNHIEALPSVIASLSNYDLPCIVVNDGSTDATREVLDRLAAATPGLSCLHRPQNGGKGRALKDGITLAARQGYTHVLLLDADGQHDTNSVPDFLALSREHPQAIILGNPIFGSDIPWERLVFRQISRALVWLQCLSFTVGDPFCGFRLLPLASAKEVVLHRTASERMTVDIEMLVRAHWMGVRIYNVNTPVCYPEGGKSHFRYWEDNLEISKLHIKLILGMLRRSPGLLMRAGGAFRAQRSNRAKSYG